MEDAVEMGLRSAFSEVGFTSFGNVLAGFKLKGMCLSTSHRVKLIVYTFLPAGKQALLYYFTDELHEFLEAALSWYNAHARSDITPFLKKRGDRLKARVQASAAWFSFAALRCMTDLNSRLRWSP